MTNTIPEAWCSHRHGPLLNFIRVGLEIRRIAAPLSAIWGAIVQSRIATPVCHQCATGAPLILVGSCETEMSKAKRFRHGS